MPGLIVIPGLWLLRLLGVASCGGLDEVGQAIRHRVKRGMARLELDDFAGWVDRRRTGPLILWCDRAIKGADDECRGHLLSGIPLVWRRSVDGVRLPVQPSRRVRDVCW